METLKLIIKGGVIGVANIIPGVSGGTMAVVLGLYERLIDAVSNYTKLPEKRKEYTIFLAQVGIGAVVAIKVLAALMDYLLTNHPGYTYMFFIGLILGSVPSVYRAHDDMKIDAGAVLSFISGATLILLFGLLGPQSKPEVAIAGAQLSHAPGQLMSLMFSGFLAGGSMIVPGVSGSFMLVLLGEYATVIRAVKQMDMLLISVIGVGAVLGVLGFAKLINFCMTHYARDTMYFILGLVVASVVPIFPGWPLAGTERLSYIILAIIGAAITWFSDRPKPKMS